LTLPALVIAVVAFYTLGLAVGAVAKSPQGVAGIIGIIMIPMAYLSGGFHPTPLLPVAVRAMSWLLPLRYLISGLTSGISGHTAVSAQAAGCGGLALSAGICALLAVNVGVRLAAGSADNKICLDRRCCR
jgi:ABC-2 type transport system permease protein